MDCDCTGSFDIRRNADIRSISIVYGLYLGRGRLLAHLDPDWPYMARLDGHGYTLKLHMDRLIA